MMSSQDLHESNLRRTATIIAHSTDISTVEHFFARNPTPATAPWLYYMMYRAVSMNNLLVVRWLLKNEETRNKMCDAKTGLIVIPEGHPPDGFTLLQRAAFHNSFEMVQTLLPYTGSEQQLPSSCRSETAIDHAIDFGKWELVYLFLRSGAKWELINWNQMHIYGKDKESVKEAVKRMENQYVASERVRNCGTIVCVLRHVMRKRGAPHDLATHVARTLVWPTCYDLDIPWSRTPSVFAAHNDAAKKVKI